MPQSLSSSPQPRSPGLDVGTRAGQIERALFIRYQETCDLAARAELIKRFLPLARRLAMRYERTTEPFEDLFQVASLALVKAIDRYDPQYGEAFTSYAVPTILGELRRHFRDSGWALHVPRSTQERMLLVSKTAEQMSGELGRSPTPQQLAIRLDLPVEQVVEAIEARAAYTTSSLDAPVRSADDDQTTVGGSIGDVDAGYELVEDRATVGRAIGALPRRERAILYLRFSTDLTQLEIGERLGMSQMHVSRLLRRALDRVRVIAEGA